MQERALLKAFPFRRTLSLAAAALLIAACSPAAPPVQEAAPQPGAGGTAPAPQGPTDLVLRVATGEDFDSIDPHRGQGLTHTTWIPLVYETLVWVDVTGTPVPGIAKSWEISPDGTRYEFTLRDDVRWHNGRTLVADDVKANIERIANPDTGAALAGPFGNIASIETPNSTTVILNLATPNSALLANLAFQGRAGLIAPEAIDADNTIVDHVGTGPFVFDDYRVGDRYVVSANPDYWGGAPTLSGVEVRIIPDASTRLAAVRQSEIDFAWLPPVAQGFVAEQAGDVQMQRIQENRGNYFAINMQKPPFDDVRLREAMHLAVSRADIVAAGHDGYADATLQPFFKDSFWYIDDLELRTTADIARARQLVEEAGYVGQEVTILQWDALGSDTEAQIVASAWEEIGLKVNIELADIGTVVGAVFAGETDVAYIWIGVILDPIRPYEYFDGNSPRHPLSGNIQSETMTANFARSLEVSDAEERKRLYREILKENYESFAMFYTVSPYNYVALNPRVSGFTMGLYVHYSGEGGITTMALD